MLSSGEWRGATPAWSTSPLDPSRLAADGHGTREATDPFYFVYLASLCSEGGRCLGFPVRSPAPTRGPCKSPGGTVPPPLLLQGWAQMHPGHSANPTTLSLGDCFKDRHPNWASEGAPGLPCAILPGTANPERRAWGLQESETSVIFQMSYFCGPDSFQAVVLDAQASPPRPLAPLLQR